MDHGQRVLVVDGETETEEVLRAVLEPRGLRVDRIRSMAGSNETLRPSLLVIDDDGSDPPAAPSEQWQSVPRIVIGTARVPEGSGSDPTRHFLRKPFQYPELIAAVEQLLDRRAA